MGTVLVVVIIFELGMITGLLRERCRKFGQRYWMNKCLNDWAERYAEEWDALAQPNADQKIVVNDFADKWAV
jgi:hypothetical protein